MYDFAEHIALYEKLRDGQTKHEGELQKDYINH